MRAKTLCLLAASFVALNYANHLPQGAMLRSVDALADGNLKVAAQQIDLGYAHRHLKAAVAPRSAAVKATLKESGTALVKAIASAAKSLDHG